jgi:hypothetical protein
MRKPCFFYRGAGESWLSIQVSHSLGAALKAVKRTHALSWVVLTVLTVAAVFYFYLVAPSPKLLNARIVELFGADGRPIRPPREVTLTGDTARELAALFPGAGSWQPFARFAAVVSRYKVFLHYSDGSQQAIFVKYDLSSWSDAAGGRRNFDKSSATILQDLVNRAASSQPASRAATTE